MPLRPALALALALAPLLLLASPARGEQGELAWQLELSGGWSTHDVADDSVRRGQVLIAGGARYAATDFVEMGAMLRGGLSLGGGPDAEALVHGLAEARVVLDALTWVPYLAAGGGVLVRQDGSEVWAGTGTGPRTDVTVHIGGGVDYRPARRWAVGVVVRYHVLLTDLGDATGPLELGLVWSLFRQ